MARKKIICGGCRRSYNNDIEFCPFCGEANPLLSLENEEDKNKELAEAAFNEENDIDEYAVPEDDEEYILPESDEETNEAKYIEQDTEYVDYGSDEPEEDVETSNSEQSNYGFMQKTNRIPIKWTDEKEKDDSNNDDMYNTNGEYNINYDHYYDDTKTKIDDELENLTTGRDKAIIKIVSGFAAVIAIIVYLILTLY